MTAILYLYSAKLSKSQNLCFIATPDDTDGCKCFYKLCYTATLQCALEVPLINIVPYSIDITSLLSLNHNESKNDNVPK